MIYSDFVIKQSNLSWCYIQHCNDISRWAEHKSDIENSQKTPAISPSWARYGPSSPIYLVVQGIFWEYLGKNGSHYNGTALYFQIFIEWKTCWICLSASMLTPILLLAVVIITLDPLIEWHRAGTGPLPEAFMYDSIGRILELHPANERCRYKVTASLIGWAQT